MSENSGGSGDKFLFFLAGAGIGAVLALLFAPKSGRETRELIARTATDSRDFVTNKVGEGRRFVEDTRRKVGDDFTSFLDKSKEAVARQKEQLSAAFEAGKAAYREEKGIPNNE
jgi:gas vesicle protein